MKPVNRGDILGLEAQTKHAAEILKKFPDLEHCEVEYFEDIVLFFKSCRAGLGDEIDGPLIFRRSWSDEICDFCANLLYNSLGQDVPQEQVILDFAKTLENISQKIRNGVSPTDSEIGLLKGSLVQINSFIRKSFNI